MDGRAVFAGAGRSRAGNGAAFRGRAADDVIPPGAVASEQPSFGDRYELPPFYREFEDVYRQLYDIYPALPRHLTA